MKKLKLFLAAGVSIAIVAIFLLLLNGFVVYVLWNTLAASLLIPPITYLNSIVVYVLMRVFFHTSTPKQNITVTNNGLDDIFKTPKHYN